MTIEKEITVETKLTKEELNKILIEKGFKIVKEYKVIDKYMVQKDQVDLENYLDTLSKSVLIRNILSDIEYKYLMYKYKKYNDDGEIVKQGSIKCPIESLEKAEELLNALSYTKLLDINDNVTVYVNNETEIHVQEVNNKHIYIEMEMTCNTLDKKYININDMIKDLEKYDLPYDRSNYFVKKAEIELKEKLEK